MIVEVIHGITENIRVFNTTAAGNGNLKTRVFIFQKMVGLLRIRRNAFLTNIQTQGVRSAPVTDWINVEVNHVLS
jgi:hypothetical protein